jgi:hypothetical protein
MPKRPIHRCCLSALFALGLLHFPVGQHTAAEDSQAARQRASSATAPPAITQTKALKPPLYLEVRASVRGATSGPFVPDIALHPGAQIALQARTSGDARVYMLHCDAHAQLSVFPDAGGIYFRADQWVSLPAADMPIQLGAEPGNETVYVIATRDALVQTDSRLQHWLQDSVDQSQSARCGVKLDALLAGASAPVRLPPTAASPPLRKLPYALRGVDLSKPSGPIARAFAESDGVVVLRFAYVNVPRVPLAAAAVQPRDAHQVH